MSPLKPMSVLAVSLCVAAVERHTLRRMAISRPIGTG